MKQKKTIELESILTEAKTHELAHIIDEIPTLSFLDYLHQLMEEKGIQKADIIRKSMLSRTYAYQILQGTKQAGRDKVLQLSLALSCTIEETNRLLTLAAHQRLYARNQRDAVLIFCIKNQMNIEDVESYLNEYQLPLLVNYD